MVNQNLGMEIKVFLDTSALISMVASKTGASRELFKLGSQGKIDLITNLDAVIETQRNLEAKLPSVAFLFISHFVNSTVITVFDSPTFQLVQKISEYTEWKDAPIVAGAIQSESKYLATFDRKHLINPPQVRKNSGLIIETSGKILNMVREEIED